MEKRLIAFDCRPLRFFCGKCEKPFSMDETERVHRQTSKTSLSQCLLVDLTIQEPHHMSNASIAVISVISRQSSTHLYDLIATLTPRRYEPVLNDPRDSGSIREIPMDLATPGRSRSPSILTPRSKVPLAPSSGPGGGEQFFAKRARKLRDSWSFRSALPVGYLGDDLI